MKNFILTSLFCLLLVTSIAPAYASITVQVQANGSLEDKLINSPILILGTIILVNIIALIYRKVRK
jgi:hypothetical protein